MCLVWVLHITLTGDDWWWLWMQCPSAFGFAKGEPAVGGSNSNIGNFPTLSTFRLLPKQNIFLHFNFQRSLTFWHTLIILNLLLLLHAYKRRIQFLQCLNMNDRWLTSIWFAKVINHKIQPDTKKFTFQAHVYLIYV